jgi:hypothetical protein
MISTTERRSGEPAREHARIPCTIPVELTHDERTPGFEADAVDLSAGGLSLRSTSLPEVGAQLHCRFDTLPGGTRISGRGEVVWAKPSGDRSGEFGLRFTHIDARAQALISEMIAERVATGGISLQPQPRMATLEFEENEGPITAKLTKAVGRDVVFEQPLEVLALGRGVVAHADKTLGHGNILRVDLRMDNGTPTLALTVRFSKEQEDFGEYDWGEPESGTLPRPETLEFLADAAPDIDTVPDLAAPGGRHDRSQPMAAAADGSHVTTHAGGTLAPVQDVPAAHVPTRSGGMLAPARNADPLSAEAASAALARLEAEERAALDMAELGTPLAAVRAARTFERDTVPTEFPFESRFARGSVFRRRNDKDTDEVTAPGSSAAAAPTSPRAFPPGAELTASYAQPGSTRGSQPPAAPGSQWAADRQSETRQTLAFAAENAAQLNAQYARDRDTAPAAPPAARLTPPLELVHETATTTEFDRRKLQAALVRDTATTLEFERRTPPLDPSAPRDTAPASEPEARLTPPLDPRQPLAAVAVAGAGLAGSKRAKQMDLTFAGDEEDFEDADEYEEHSDDEPGYDAIAVLDTETFTGGDDHRQTAPLQLRAAGARRVGLSLGAAWSGGAVPGDTSNGGSSPGEHWGEATASGDLQSPEQHYSSGAGDRWSPVTESARKSALVRFLRIIAALVDGMQHALGIGGRALKRVSDSVVPVLRRQLARRSTMRGVGGPRVRRSAGAPAQVAATGWKLPRGSGRLVLLAVLMLGCGILLVYAFPHGGGEQIDLHRPVQVDAEDTAVEGAHATETAVNPAADPVENAAASKGQAVASTSMKPQLTAASSAKALAAPARAARPASDDKLAFGSKQVPNAQRYVLRTNNPITVLQGKSDPGGFTVIVPNTRALDKAGPIAQSNRAVSSAKILNRGGYAELSVRFAEGRSPAYRVSAQQTGLEVLIGQ